MKDQEHSKPDAADVGNQATAGPSGDRQVALQNDPFREFLFVWIAVNLIDAAPRRVRRGRLRPSTNNGLSLPAVTSYGRSGSALRKSASAAQTDRNTQRTKLHSWGNDSPSTRSCSSNLFENYSKSAILRPRMLVN